MPNSFSAPTKPAKGQAKLSELIGFVPQDFSASSPTGPSSNSEEQDPVTMVADLWAAVADKQVDRVRALLSAWPQKMICPPRSVDGKTIRISEWGMRSFHKDIMPLLHARWPLTAKIMVTTALRQDNVESFEWAARANPPKWAEATGLVRVYPSGPPAAVSSIGVISDPILLSLSAANPHLFPWLLRQAGSSTSTGKLFLWLFDHVDPLAKARAAGTLKALDIPITLQEPFSDSARVYASSKLRETIVLSSCSLLGAAAQSGDSGDGATGRWIAWMSSPLAISTIQDMKASTRTGLACAFFIPLGDSFATPAALVRLARTASSVPHGEEFLKALVFSLSTSGTAGGFSVPPEAISKLGFSEILASHLSKSNFCPGTWASTRATLPDPPSPTLLDAAFFVRMELVDSLLRNAEGLRLVLDRMAQPDAFPFCCAFFDRPINKLTPLLDLHKPAWLSWRDSRGNNAAHWMVTVTLPRRPSERKTAAGLGALVPPTVTALIELNRSVPGLMLEENNTGATPLSLVPNAVAFDIERSILSRSARAIPKVPVDKVPPPSRTRRM